MKIAAAEAIASLAMPKPDKILPDPFDKSVVPAVAEAVKKAYLKEQ